MTLSAVAFLFHIAIEIPVAIQGVLSPSALPFLDLNNTAVAILKLFSALSFGSCVAALLCFSLPGRPLVEFTLRSITYNAYAYTDFLPGKRALAIGLTVYHCIASTILYQAPRFIPHSFGAVCEA